MKNQDELLCLFPPLTFKEKFVRFLCRNFLHRNEFSKEWYRPVWLAWVIGGNWDGGNGGGWYPGIRPMFRRYYKEQWWQAGYTIWNWLSLPGANASSRKKLNVQPHGLW